MGYLALQLDEEGCHAGIDDGEEETALYQSLEDVSMLKYPLLGKLSLLKYPLLGKLSMLKYPFLGKLSMFKQIPTYKAFMSKYPLLD